MDSDIRRGVEAERVLNEPLLKEAFEKVEAQIVASLKTSRLIDAEQDRQLILQLKALALVRSQIEQVVQTGKLAQIEKESLGSRIRRLVA